LEDPIAGLGILLVEDDGGVARIVEQALSEAGHAVDLAASGGDGFARALGGSYDAIVLDVLLPEMDGFEICRRLRHERITTPILMLTARDAVQDRVSGLDAGADDYLTKPFALEELLARIRALARRATNSPGDEILSVGDLRLDPSSHAVERAGNPIALTAQEFALLEFLMRNPGRILSKDQILARVWGYDVERSSNVVEIYIHYLRRRIDRGSAHPLIRTVRRVGYTIKP
jgi:DNA-binding response OmpR family regulator